MSTILDKIIADKYIEVERAKQKISLASIKKDAEANENSPRFVDAIKAKHQQGLSAVIAEVKKASPSKGVIREDFNPQEIARSYQAGGAACLSVLTDEKYFQGHLSYMTAAKKASNLPVLRKDFMVDDYQLFEAKAHDADCILLIVSALDKNQLRHFSQLAATLNLDVLVEVHDKDELDIALDVAKDFSQPLIGINNRNLHTFETSLNTTIELLNNIPSDAIVVTESGIHNRDDVRLMIENEVKTFLVGESFMRADDPGEKLKELFYSEN